MSSHRTSGRQALQPAAGGHAPKPAVRTRQVVLQGQDPHSAGTASGRQLIFQQLLFADEVRALRDLHIEEVPVTDTELQLALQIIDQVSEDAHD
jgi:non-homologous end joining protein Ku